MIFEKLFKVGSFEMLRNCIQWTVKMKNGFNFINLLLINYIFQHERRSICRTDASESDYIPFFHWDSYFPFLQIHRIHRIRLPIGSSARSKSYANGSRNIVCQLSSPLFFLFYLFFMDRKKLLEIVLTSMKNKL